MSKKILSFLVSLLLSVTAVGCDGSANYVTPTGVNEDSDLLKYTNNTYGYVFSYPDIFTEEEKANNGVTFRSDDTLLIIWADKNDKNLTLEESYDKAKAQYNNVSDGGMGRIQYYFHFSDSSEKTGYYHSIMYENVIYSFVIVYPTDEKDKYEEYITEMIPKFLIES